MNLGFDQMSVVMVFAVIHIEVYCYVLLHDGDTCWEKHCYVIFSLSKHYRVYFRNPDGKAYCTPRLYDIAHCSQAVHLYSM